MAVNHNIDIIHIESLIDKNIKVGVAITVLIDLNAAHIQSMRHNDPEIIPCRIIARWLDSKNISLYFATQGHDQVLT